jgi:hypothetical protein
MENSSNVFADIENRTYWPMARAANLDLHLTGSRRVNMLLTGTADLVRAALARLTPELRGPIQTWMPPGPVQLPPPTQHGTLILPDVEALSAVDQYRLLRWLEQSSPRTQVISTTTAPLLDRVEAGLFDERLYYRLNVACVDLTA